MKILSWGDTDSRPEKKLVLFFATALLANPVILYLLTGSLTKSILITLGAVAIIQVTYSWKKLKILTVYLFNCIALLSLLIHAEVILIHMFPEYVIKNLYTMEDGHSFNRPFLNERFEDEEYVANYLTNAQGLRIPESCDPRKTVGRVDWLILGDSYTQGAQVPFEDLYTTILNERFPDKIVLNAGISGSGIGHEYNYYVKAGYRHQPKLVILQLCSFNDFMNVIPREISLTDRLINDWAIIRLLLSDIRYQHSSELPLGRWTEPFRPDEEGNANYNVFFNASSPQKEEDLSAFMRYVELFNDAVKANGAKLLIVLIPSKEQVEQRYLNEVLREFSIHPEELDMLRPNKILKEQTGELGIGFVDALSNFKEAKNSAFFEQDEHLNKNGHKILTSAIADFLTEDLGKPNVTQLSEGLVGDRYPMHSADGATISYQSFRDGNMELFLADANFQNPKRLTSTGIDETHPSLSKDSSLIIFTEGSADSPEREVVMMDLNDSSRQTITVGEFEFGAIPTFSASNQTIAYAGWNRDKDSGNYSTPQIVIQDMQSQKLTAVTDGSRESWRPVFSPDEKTVVYITRVNGQFDLFSYDLVNKVEQRLTTTKYDEWDPQFSPDGSSLVYAAKADGNWDLFLYDLDQNSSKRLTKTLGDEWDPSVSPDGSTILFAGTFGLIEAVYSMPFPQ